MTVENPPGVLNDESTNAEVQRHMLQAILGANIGSFGGGVGANNGGAHGVANPDHLRVTQQGSPTMGVTVSAGMAVITGTVSAAQGPYSFYNGAPVDLTIAAADSTNARRDLVIAQIQDDDYSGASNTARLTVVTGTPAGSPSDPSLASYPNALVLARVTVAANATSITNANITDLRTIKGRVGCTATRASNLSMGGSALTAVTWTAETVDTDGFITPTSSTVTVPTGLGGIYAVTFTAAFASSITGCYARILRNGGSTSVDRWQTATATMGDISHTVVIPLAAGDTISVGVWNGGSAVNMTGGSLNVYRVGS